jgi:hypothetical protein
LQCKCKCTSSALLEHRVYFQLQLCQQSPHYAASEEENNYSEAAICFPITAKICLAIHYFQCKKKKKEKKEKKERSSVAQVCDQTIPTERPPLVGEVSATFEDRGCKVVSVTDSYGRVLSF